MVEAFLRGLFGDPLGAYKESKLAQRNLDARQQALLDQLAQLQARSNSLDSRMHEIRAELARRYSREFPIPPKK
jgi:hypothetical protein